MNIKIKSHEKHEFFYLLDTFVLKRCLSKGSFDTALRVSDVMMFGLSTLRVYAYAYTPNREMFYVGTIGVIDGMKANFTDFSQHPSLIYEKPNILICVKGSCLNQRKYL